MFISRMVALLAFNIMGNLRNTASKNLQFALPHLPPAQNLRIVKGVFINFGRLLAEFALLPKLNPKNISKIVIYEGFENFSESVRRGKGTLFLTAHFGAWELSPFAQAVYGHPLKFVIRPIDNPYLDLSLIHI